MITETLLEKCFAWLLSLITSAVSPRFKDRRLYVGMLALSAVALGGCQVAKIPGNAVRTVAGTQQSSVQTDPALLQQDIFRFCDEFSNRISVQLDRLSDVNPELDKSSLVRLKLSLHYRMLEIASGANDYINLCDLLCMVSLSRYAIEQNPSIAEAGEIGKETIQLMMQFEDRAYQLASATFGEEPSKTLQNKIVSWVPDAYAPGSVLYSHYAGLASQIGKETASSQDAQTNLLGALMLDPLSGLDPTRREISKTRLFAERAMYVSQRMPKIIRMEGELASYRLMSSPEIDTLLTDVDSVSQSVDRVSRVAEELPQVIQSEREAIFASIDEQTPGMTRLVEEAHGTMEASGEAMAASTELVESVDRFLERLGVYDEPEEPAPESAEKSPGEPFRIQDYTEAAAQLSQTAEQLNILVTNLDQAIATATGEEVSAALQATVSQGREIIDHAYWRMILLVAASCLLVFATALLYRFIVTRRPA
jgi:hypothetical protein